MVVTKVKFVHLSHIIVVLHTVVHKILNKDNRSCGAV